MGRLTARIGEYCNRKKKVYKIIINLGVAAYEQSNVMGEHFSADDSKIFDRKIL